MSYYHSSLGQVDPWQTLHLGIEAPTNLESKFKAAGVAAPRVAEAVAKYKSRIKPIEDLCKKSKSLCDAMKKGRLTMYGMQWAGIQKQYNDFYKKGEAYRISVIAKEVMKGYLAVARIPTKEEWIRSGVAIPKVSEAYSEYKKRVKVVEDLCKSSRLFCEELLKGKLAIRGPYYAGVQKHYNDFYKKGEAHRIKTIAKWAMRDYLVPAPVPTEAQWVAAGVVPGRIEKAAAEYKKQVKIIEDFCKKSRSLCEYMLKGQLASMGSPQWQPVQTHYNDFYKKGEAHRIKVIAKKVMKGYKAPVPEGMMVVDEEGFLGVSNKFWLLGGAAAAVLILFTAPDRKKKSS